MKTEVFLNSMPKDSATVLLLDTPGNTPIGTPGSDIAGNIFLNSCLKKFREELLSVVTCFIIICFQIFNVLCLAFPKGRVGYVIIIIRTHLYS